jgi:large subunit ribosomal protein L15
MRMNDLAPSPGSRKDPKRVGRGHGSGHGGRSGKGQDGQLSRSGGGKGKHFEGGQTPLYRRLPKLPGFTNRFRVEYAIVNVSRLDETFKDGDVVDVDALFDRGIIKSKTVSVKVLGDGDLTKGLTVRVDKVSGGAKDKIDAAGGTVEAS